MGLFSKKYDKVNDSLRFEFDSKTQKYFTMHGDAVVPYERLNNKTKKLLDVKNEELITNPTLLNAELEKVRIRERFKKLYELGYPCHSFEYLGLNNGTMSKEMEIYLNGLLYEEDVLLGIHRVGQHTTNEDIEDILTNGLIMTGHLGGAANHEISLSNNVSYYPTNKTIIKELMYADQYKNSIGSILIKIPDKDLVGNIYYTDINGATRLNPKYILGYVPLEPNHHIETIVEKTINCDYTDYNEIIEPIYLGEELEQEKSKSL